MRPCFPPAPQEDCPLEKVFIIKPSDLFRMAGREQIGRHCPYCNAIITYDEYFCRACHKRLEDQQDLTVPSTPRAETCVISVRNPIFAGILSAISPGLGQFYNGDTLKGVAIVAAFITVSFGIAGAEYRTPLFYGIWVIAIIEGFWSARRINQYARPFGRTSYLLYALLVIYGMIIGLYLYTGQPDGELPEWLQEPSEAQPDWLSQETTPTQEGVEATPVEDLPEWLQNAPAQAQEPHAQPVEGLPDWLMEDTGAKAETPAAEPPAVEPVETLAEELPAWLTAQEEPAVQPAAALPDDERALPPEEREDNVDRVLHLGRR